MEEDLLLMAQTDEAKSEEAQAWYLDSGCSNHMCGNKEWFINLDKSCNQHVKLGDDRKMKVEGRGSLRMEINGRVQVITSVYYVLGLKTNLLSVGQLQQKGLKIVIEDDKCEVWHKQLHMMIMESSMTRNRMFIILAKMRETREVEECNVLSVTEDNEKI